MAKVLTAGVWFLTNQLYMLANGEEIKALARQSKIHLIDAIFKTEHDEEAEGKPEEILLDQYKHGESQSDSGSHQPSEAELLAAQEAEAALAAVAAAAAAKAKAKAAAEAKVKAAVQ